MSYEEMTKGQLLSIAKELDITGRHELSKDDLLSAILEVAEDDGDQDDGDVVEVASKDVLVAMKRRSPSARPRSATGKVLRQGLNLSGNVPYQPKPYALAEAYATEPTGAYLAAVKAAPGQVQLILRCMRREGVVGADEAITGREIVELALTKGYLKTRIGPAALFSYYAKLLQALGVVHYETDEE
jgi:hypothetical protein